MIGGIALRISACCPTLSRVLLRGYLQTIGWVPARARWLVWSLEQRLVPANSIRTVSLGRHLRLEIDLASAMGRDIYYHGTHEPELDRFLKRTLHPGMTFVDVGANVGQITVLASRLEGQSGLVLAIEASPRAVARLRRNVELNSLTNIQIHQLAICDRDEPVQFFLGRGTDSGSSSLSQPHDYEGEAVTVPGVRLDDLVARCGLQHVDCIKLDIEGAELAALGGCEQLLAGPNPPIIIFEYHREVASRTQWSLADAEQLLGRFGYTLEQLSGSQDVSKSNVIALPACRSRSSTNSSSSAALSVA